MRGDDRKERNTETQRESEDAVHDLLSHVSNGITAPVAQDKKGRVQTFFALSQCFD